MQNLAIFLVGAISISIVFVVAFAYAMRVALFYQQKRVPIQAISVRKKNFIIEKEKDRAVAEYLETLS